MSKNSGFTFIEVLVVMAIFLMIASFALFVSLDGYRGYAFRSERDIAISLLQKARSRAINNICSGVTCTDGKQHGINFSSSGYTLFQGSSFAGRDVAEDLVVPFNSKVVVSGTTEITFQKLTGMSGGGAVNFTDNAGRSSQITINPEGQITWSN